MPNDNAEFEAISWDPSGIAYYTPSPTDEGEIDDRPRAGAGLNPLEAMQLTAALNLPLSYHGLVDNPGNRKILNHLNEIYADMRRCGFGIDIAT